MSGSGGDQPRLGTAVAALLAARGIEVVFGIPGVHTVELYRGLPDSGLRHVTPRHEQGAGFMADGYARATGKIAACFVITGPGLLNIATALAQALADSVPILVITTLNPRATLGRGEGRLHELRDQSAVARAVSALALTVTTPDGLVPALDEAFALFASARPGPVVIEIPIDLLSEPWQTDLRVRALPRPPVPDAAAVMAAARLVNDALRPLLILGGGAVGAADLVIDLAERLDAPVLLTANAKGLLPGGHRLLAGGCLPLPAIRGLIASADVTLAIGTEFGETDYEYYGEGPLVFGGPLIRVDIDPRQLLRNVTPDMPICGDARGFIAALLPTLASGPREGPRRVEAARAALPAEIEARIARHRPLIETIWRTLPEAVLIGDSTEPSYAAGLIAEPPAPRRFMSAATGFGTLGYALPAAIGAAIAAPDRIAVCVIGDGGLHFSLPEIAAAVEARVRVVILLWNDQCYGEIEKYMVRRQIRPVGVHIHATDFALATRGLGAVHVTATDPASLAAALVAAASHDGPTVIEMDAGRFLPIA